MFAAIHGFCRILLLVIWLQIIIIIRALVVIVKTARVVEVEVEVNPQNLQELLESHQAGLFHTGNILHDRNQTRFVIIRNLKIPGL